MWDRGIERERERYDAEANHKRIRNLLFKIEILRTVLGFLMNKEILFLLDRVRFFLTERERESEVGESKLGIGS